MTNNNQENNQNTPLDENNNLESTPKKENNGDETDYNPPEAPVKKNRIRRSRRFRRVRINLTPILEACANLLGTVNNNTVTNNPNPVQNTNLLTNNNTQATVNNVTTADAQTQTDSNIANNNAQSNSQTSAQDINNSLVNQPNNCTIKISLKIENSSVSFVNKINKQNKIENQKKIKSIRKAGECKPTSNFTDRFNPRKDDEDRNDFSNLNSMPVSAAR